jgi:hypothetical protein
MNAAKSSLIFVFSLLILGLVAAPSASAAPLFVSPWKLLADNTIDPGIGKLFGDIASANTRLGLDEQFVQASRDRAAISNRISSARNLRGRIAEARDAVSQALRQRRTPLQKQRLRTTLVALNACLRLTDWRIGRMEAKLRRLTPINR